MCSVTPADFVRRQLLQRRHQRKRRRLHAQRAKDKRGRIAGCEAGEGGVNGGWVVAEHAQRGAAAGVAVDDGVSHCAIISEPRSGFGSETGNGIVGGP
jgi:hypothetical protein